MKKIYKNRLPKDKEVKNTNVRVENGEVVVEVELKDKFEPKFGDIVRIEHPDVDYFKRNYVISIFPNKEVPQKSVDDFFDIAAVNMDGYVDIDDQRVPYNHNHVYLASPSEKKELFDKLAEVGKRWNEETKRLEDIRWKPKLNEVYFYIDIYGNVLHEYNHNSSDDRTRISMGNCFRTPKSAKPYAQTVREIFKS